MSLDGRILLFLDRSVGSMHDRCQAVKLTIRDSLQSIYLHFFNQFEKSTYILFYLGPMV